MVEIYADKPRRQEKFMKKTFQAYVEYDLDYSGYVVDVPSLPGCMSQGKTKREAIRNVRDAIEGYLAVLKKREQRTVPIADLGLTRVQVAF